jgi:acetolactate synthase-1/3 small subunit
LKGRDKDMTSEKPDTLVDATSNAGEDASPEVRIRPVERTGQSDAPDGAARTYTLVITLDERPGAVDRVVGLLRRRRGNIHTLTIAQSELPNVARITTVVDDSTVVVEHLVEQLQKIVDVREVLHLSSEQLVERELALIKVNSDAEHSNAIIELGQQYGAYVADVASEAVTLEVTGSAEKVAKLVAVLEPFGIREVARSGSVAMPRGAVTSRA